MGDGVLVASITVLYLLQYKHVSLGAFSTCPQAIVKSESSVKSTSVAYKQQLDYGDAVCINGYMFQNYGVFALSGDNFGFGTPTAIIKRGD